MKGWTHVGDIKDRAKGDQRILGRSDFVTKILRQAEEDYEQKTILKNKGYTQEKIADMISEMYDISMDDLLSKGRYPSRVEARSLFCYIASHELGISVTDLAKRIGMTPSAITYAVERGKKIAKRKNFKLR